MEKTQTDQKPSYFQAGISAISPWSSRSATPKPGSARETEDQTAEPGLGSQRGGDHTVHHRHRLSLRKYPRDTPPLNVLWFHAVDVPKRKNLPSGEGPPKPEKPVLPKKWNPFSSGDSRALEATFQKLSDEAEAAERRKLGLPKSEDGDDTHNSQALIVKAKVPVNEDFLFDVDVEERELAPAYWSGPVYEVRRGTWFYQESSVLRPCDENLATQLEEGYLKVKPWRFAQDLQRQRSLSQPKSRPASWQPGEDSKQIKKGALASVITPKSSSGNLRGEQGSSSPTTKEQDSPKQPSAPTPEHPKTHRLFGAHMNSVVTYQDANTAWLLTDDFLSRMSSTMYQRFAGGGHFAGVKLHRGWADLKAKKEEAKDGKGKAPSAGSAAKDPKDGDGEGKPQSLTKRNTDLSEPSPSLPPEGEPLSPSETRRQDLERQMSNLMASAQIDDPEKQEEEVRRRAEKEIQDDYKDREGDEQGREIEHLLLVTHGIGQRLGLRMESVNFVHDVNTLRKTLKGVYANSADLQALNNEVDKLPKNCRVQVLPIVWRHLLDFPKQSLKHNRKEYDLGDAHFAEDDEYPNLDDITVEGVPAVRNLITDLALDILLYQSPAYKGHISRIVRQECNRIYHLFKERNPNFNGKVSLVGHSLGSAVMFDLLCRQREEKSQRERHGHHKSTDHGLKLDFDVEDFYALGSPIGLFQMLKGRRITARNTYNGVPAETPMATDDPFLASPAAETSTASVKENHFEITTSSPKCQRVFNIFHPTDPISYRLEPLISPAMSSLKPQPLPYTKKGIFGAPVGQGLTGIGARVGQSVSGLWSSFSSGIASSLLNRSLGLSADDQSKLGNPVPGQQSRVPLSVGVGTNIGAGVISPVNSTTTPPSDTEVAGEERKRKLAQDGIQNGDVGEHPPTLIDSEIETLYSGFQKRRKSQQSENDLVEQEEWAEMEERSRRLRREESKVRALNSNGRVDYSIQEGAFDISLLASIASHLSYYADEDVSHFMISQLLARHRIIRKAKSAPNFKA
ncbi:hypothetical protein K490DRAFT_39399 [Saccharata proteae CBS 121410]|uniref:DDHD domain-containing protein n=1 Tax=Saccharata proteae CBS 121410 TaxID=1314787 RepID=A0A9P4HXA7_9PEZI|nr:hypothetical protein K490DRAFT_39399 [Saccharata proteae CBS 121410]